jgi:hypothetical protein
MVQKQKEIAHLDLLYQHLLQHHSQRASFYQTYLFIEKIYHQIEKV